jgi:trans-aconitate methyltransferase
MPHSPSDADYLYADLTRMSRARNYVAWQHRLVTLWLGRRVLEYGCGLGNFTAALLDRYIVPVISQAERLFPPPFGQSLLAVLVKRTT